MFKIISNSKFNQTIKESIYKHFLEENSRLNQLKIDTKVFELQNFLGKLVIVVSNEIDNLCVGFAKEIIYVSQSSEPMLLIKDIVSNEEKVPFGKIFAYTEQKFLALNKLEANERISIFYESERYNLTDKSSSQKSTLIPPEEWKDIILNCVDNFQK